MRLGMVKGRRLEAGKRGRLEDGQTSAAFLCFSKINNRYFSMGKSRNEHRFPSEISTNIREIRQVQ